jgi:hypothetical protein
MSANRDEVPATEGGGIHADAARRAIEQAIEDEIRLGPSPRRDRRR